VAHEAAAATSYYTTSALRTSMVIFSPAAQWPGAPLMK